MRILKVTKRWVGAASLSGIEPLDNIFNGGSLPLDERIAAVLIFFDSAAQMSCLAEVIMVSRAFFYWRRGELGHAEYSVFFYSDMDTYLSVRSRPFSITSATLALLSRSRGKKST